MTPCSLRLDLALWAGLHVLFAAVYGGANWPRA